MKKAELKVFRIALQGEETELGNGNRNREDLAIEVSPEELDRIQQAGARDYAMNRLERDSNRLREVRGALHRIASGTFGICARCEENINPKRLAAIPWASFCIVCQETVDCEQKAPEGGVEEPFAMTA